MLTRWRHERPGADQARAVQLQRPVPSFRTFGFALPANYTLPANYAIFDGEMVSHLYEPDYEEGWSEDEAVQYDIDAYNDYMNELL